MKYLTIIKFIRSIIVLCKLWTLEATGAVLCCGCGCALSGREDAFTAAGDEERRPPGSGQQKRAGHQQEQQQQQEHAAQAEEQR